MRRLGVALTALVAMSGPNAVFPGVFDSFADYRYLDRRIEYGEIVRMHAIGR